MAVTGVSHLTLAVRDLAASVTFYTETLGATVAVRGARSVYLELGALWLCLETAAEVSPRQDDSHIALACDADCFDALAQAISRRAEIWKENRSEGASLYFRDPDGHKLELHVGDLHSRLAYYAARPGAGMCVTGG